MNASPFGIWLTLAVRRAVERGNETEKGRRHAVVHDGDQRANNRGGLLWQVFGEFDNGVFRRGWI